MLTRRDLLKMGVIGAGGYLSFPHDRAFARPPSSFLANPRSPATVPFVTPLPVPDPPSELAAPFPEYTTPPYSGRPRGYERVGANTRFFQLVLEARSSSFHPDLPNTPIWGYRDFNVPEGQWPFVLGPTFGESISGADILRSDPQGGIGSLVREVHNIPDDPVGFGVTRFSTHFHGGHQPARADGFPENIACFPDPVVFEHIGDHYDYFYPGLEPGALDIVDGRPGATEERTARASTRWYHDHIIDFTGQNAYRGLAGFYISSDTKRLDDDPYFAQDLDDENDPDGLQLPSGVPFFGGPGFDIPLVIQDKMFDSYGRLVYNSFDHNGFLGDKFVVNGAI